jgi:hypothetical protein
MPNRGDWLDSMTMAEDVKPEFGQVNIVLLILFQRSFVPFVMILNGHFCMDYRCL